MNRKIIDPIISVLFGEWNGIQIFLIPTTLFYLLDGFSVARWVSGILTMNIHYLPLSIFLFLFLFLGFVIIKRHAYDRALPQNKYRKAEFYDFIIGLHKLLLVLVVSLAIVYVLSAFLRYFYQISMPVRYVFAFVTQLYCILLIVYHYIIATLLKPYLSDGYSRKRAWGYLLLRFRKNLWLLARYILLSVLIIIFSAYIYRTLIIFLFTPAVDYFAILTGIELGFSVYQYNSAFTILANVWIIFVAFLCSNMIFALIVKPLNLLLQSLNPIPLRTRKNPWLPSVSISSDAETIQR